MRYGAKLETHEICQTPITSRQFSLETSGTTGTPRSVAYSPEQLSRRIKTGDLYQNNVWGLTYSVSKFAGMQVLLQAITNRNSLINLVASENSQIANAIDDFEITHLSATPTYFRMLLRNKTTFRKVRQVTCGGEPLDEATLSLISFAFPGARFTNIYATTETGVLLKSRSTWFEIPDNMQDKIKIEANHLLVHSSLLGDFVGKPDEFYDTGDVVDVAAEKPNRFVFSGRTQDFVNVGGETVNLQQVERSLISLPEIIEAKVFSRKNSVTGRIIGCEVMLGENGSFDPLSIRRRLLELLPTHAVPMIINETKSIVRNKSGKKVRG